MPILILTIMPILILTLMLILILTLILIIIIIIINVELDGAQSLSQYGQVSDVTDCEGTNKSFYCNMRDASDGKNNGNR